MKKTLFIFLLVALFGAAFGPQMLVAQQFENSFGLAANHEDPQDGKPLPNGRYVTLSNTLSFGASRIMLTFISSTGSVTSNATIHDPLSPNTAYFGAAIDLDLNATGGHTGYFIAGSRSTANGRQAILIRTNTLGSVTWTRVLPNSDNSGTLDESGVSVERQSNGDVVVTLSGYNAANNNYRFAMARFSSAGVQLWSNRYYSGTGYQGFEATEACNGIAPVGGVNTAVVAVTGRYRSAAGQPTRTFIACVNAATGAAIWRRTYNSSQQRDEGLDIVYKPANGANEPAAFMAVGYAGQVGTQLWVLRASPINGFASSKTYVPNTLVSPNLTGMAVSLDVTGTRAAISGLISYFPTPGQITAGTFAMVLPFYGLELPDWTNYYASSSPLTPAPRSISRITGASAGYFVTCGVREFNPALNDAHAIRTNALGAVAATGCPVTPISVIRTPQGTSTTRPSTPTPVTWTSIFPSRTTVGFVQQSCTGQLLQESEDRNEALALEPVAPRLFPNPAAAGQGATLAFELVESGKVQIRVFDLAGREVWSHSEALSAGQQLLELPAGQWPNGAYLVQLRSPNWNETLKFSVTSN
jgi:hypothetical protein